MSQWIHLGAQGFSVRLTCVDIQRGPSVDLAQSKQRKLFLDRIAAKHLTLSWYRRPVLRFREHLGQTSKVLSPAKLCKPPAMQGFGGYILGRFLLEQPEDLGTWREAPTRGRDGLACGNGRKLLGSALIRECEHWRCTKLVLECRIVLLFATGELPMFCYEGPPTFDPDGYYTGPLPLLGGVQGMATRQSGGPFKTTSTEQWPHVPVAIMVGGSILFCYCYDC